MGIMVALGVLALMAGAIEYIEDYFAGNDLRQGVLIGVVFFLLTVLSI